jgi:hypothetical protein
MKTTAFREDVCIAAVSWVMQHLPGWVPGGISLPDAAGYDAGVLPDGVALVSLTGIVLEGLDSISVTPGRPLSFVPAKGIMTVPMTFAAIAVSGSISVEQAGPPYEVAARGSFRATLRGASLIATVSGLGPDAAAASSVSIAWAAASGPESAALPVDLDPGAIAAMKPKLQQHIRGDVSDVLTGGAPLDEKGRTLPGVLLAMLNEVLRRLSPHSQTN